MDGWRNEIENYWLIEENGIYEAFYVPTSGQVMFEEWPEDHLFEKMIAAGVKIVAFDDFKRYIRSQLSPEWQQHYEEEDRKASQKADDETSSD